MIDSHTTDLEELLNALRDEHRQVAVAADHIPALLAYIGADGHYRYVNARYSDFFGIPAGEIRGRNVREFLGEQTYGAVAGYVRRALDGERVEFEQKITYPNGQTREVMVSYVPHVDEAGTVPGFVGLVQDVSERREAERAAAGAERRLLRILEETRERLRLALTSAHAAAWWRGTDGSMNWSDEMYGLLGVDRSVEPALATWRALMHPEDRTAAIAAAEQAFRDGSEIDVAFRIIRPDGAIRWISSVGRATVDDEGRVTGLVGISQDVTEHKLAEEARRRSEARFQSLVNSASDIVLTLDANGLFAERQPTWERFTGQMWPAYSGSSPFTAAHPADRSAAEQEHAAAAAERRPFDRELRLWHEASKRHRHTYARIVALVDEHGAIAEWVGAVDDIDEERAATEANRMLAEADVLLASSLDLETTIRNICALVVQSFADWCQLSLLDGDVLQNVATRHRDPQLTEKLEERRRTTQPTPENAPVTFKVLRSGEPAYQTEISQEYLTLLASSDPAWAVYREAGAESFVTVPLIARGRVIGVLGCISGDPLRRYIERDVRVATDLARRIALAIENARLYREAQDAARAKDDFLAVVSHELRTPMTAIMGWIGLLQLGEVDESTMRLAIDSIHMSARAQSSIIEDLLEISRIVSGKLRIETDLTTVTTAVTHAIDTVRSAAEGKQISLDLVMRGTPQMVRADGRRMQQVFWNLLSNAVKFTPSGGSVRVEIDSGDAEVVVHVTDTGRGIEPAFLPHVFDRFAQSESSLTRSSTGLGLGLAIARSIIELHGGRISAQSEGLGRGATFTVAIPAAGIAARGDEDASGSAVPRADALANLRVLAVDDDDAVLAVLQSTLRRFGAEVDTAGDVRGAMLRIAQHPPDLIISDLAMPNEDGYALIEQLRAQKNRTPAIALTAYSRTEDRTRALERGFDAFLTKPIEPGDLVRAVVRVLSRSRG